MDIKDEIKQKIDIVELISRYIPIKKAGSVYKANCPFHNENTPSFSVSQSMQIFKCFGCGKGGDVFTFLMEIEGIEFKDALIRLGEMAGVDVSKHLGGFKNSKENAVYIRANETALNFFNYVLVKTNTGKEALDYLRDKRGLTLTQINDLQLGYAPNTWDSLYKYLTKKGFETKDLENAGLIKKGPKDYFDTFRGRITIPLINEQNNVVGFAGRDVIGHDPKYLNTKDTLIFRKSRFLFNLNNAKLEIKKQKHVLVAEGIFDALTPYIKGIKNIVASQGTALTIDQINLIKRYTDTAILFFDNDMAGNEATVRAIELAQNNGLMVKIATLPSGFKDPDEAARENIDILYKCFDEAVNAFDYFFAYASKKYDVKDSYGKSLIAKFLKPKIARISDEILRAHYIKKLAELLDIKDSEITINNISDPVTTKVNITEPLETPHISNILVYLLNSDSKSFKKYFKFVQENKLLTKQEEAILNEYKSQVINKKIDKKEYVKDSDFKEIVEFAFFQSLGDFGTNLELTQKILDDITKKLFVTKIKEKLTKIKNKIKQAEELNDAKKLDILNKKFNILAKQLSTTK